MESWSPGEIHTATEFCAKDLGYELKSEQHQALAAFFKAQDLFVSLPTGFGMTLCYAALPGTFDLLKGETKASVVVMYQWSTSIVKVLIIGLSSC